MAVHAIESVILRECDGYDEKTFLISRKKVVIVDGVRHEIDVYVQVLVANGYDPVFIFECKNWEDKVGKNEIIVFSEKVEATNASKGFFVAKGFTKDAVAQAKKDRRLQLLHASEVSPDIRAFIPLTIAVVERRSGTFMLRPYDVQGERTRKLEAPTAFVNGEQVVTDEYFKPLILELIDVTYKEEFNGPTKDLGTYEVTREYRKLFEKGELVVDNVDIESADVKVEFTVRLFRPQVRSYFDVETRGRFYRAEDFKVDDVQVAIGAIGTNSQENPASESADGV